MKTILKMIEGKPSIALRHMLNGLIREDRPFEVDMMTYGMKGENGICYGCAATSAVFDVFPSIFEPGKGPFHRIQSGRYPHDIRYFEMAIDDARCGQLYGLFLFCKRKDQFDTRFNGRFYLEAMPIKSQINAIETLIKELEEKGL